MAINATNNLEVDRKTRERLSDQKKHLKLQFVINLQCPMMYIVTRINKVAVDGAF